MSSVQKPIFVSIYNKKEKFPDKGGEIHKVWYEAIVGQCQTLIINSDTINRDNWFKTFEFLNGNLIYPYIYIFIGVHGIVKNGIQYIKFNENYHMSENEFMGMLSRSLSTNIYVFLDICHAGHFTLKDMEDNQISKNITIFSTCNVDEKSASFKRSTLFDNYSIGICTEWLYKNRMNPFKNPEQCCIQLNKYLESIKLKEINQRSNLLKYQFLI